MSYFSSDDDEVECPTESLIANNLLNDLCGETAKLKSLGVMNQVSIPTLWTYTWTFDLQCFDITLKKLWWLWFAYLKKTQSKHKRWEFDAFFVQINSLFLTLLNID